jgi:hypothetical protein
MMYGGGNFMHRTLWSSVLLLGIAGAATAQTSVGPLQKGATVRVWSAPKGLVARKGWIDTRSGDTLKLKVPSDAYTEYDDRWTTITVARWEIDTIDVQAQGRWWRADFTNASPRLLPEDSPVGEGSVSLVPHQTPVRVWSRANRIDNMRGVLVNQRGDTLDFTFGNTSAAVGQLRSIAMPQVDRLKVPATGFSYGKGIWRGFAIGITAGFGGTLLTSHCTQGSCSAVPPESVTNGLVGAAAGGLLGALGAYWSQHRWKDVELR